MKIPKNGSKFALPPAGTSIARCYRIVDLGTQESEWQGKKRSQHKVLFSFELYCDEKLDDGRLHSAHKRFTLSLNEKAELRKDIKNWIPSITDEQLENLDIEDLLGLPALLTITHETKNGEKRARVTAITQVFKGTPVPAGVNSLAFLSLTPEEFDEGLFDSLSEGLKKTITSSPEYVGLKVGEEPPPPKSEADYGALNDDVPASA